MDRDHIFSELTLPDAWELYRELYDIDGKGERGMTVNATPRVKYAEILTKHRKCEDCGEDMRFERNTANASMAGRWMCIADKSHTIVVVKSSALSPNNFERAMAGSCGGCRKKTPWR